LENGIFTGVFFIFLLFIRILQLLRRGGRNADAETLMIGYLLLYAMVQSVFNRYLLAAGNPLSVFLLLCFVYPVTSLRKTNTADA
jgi:hypothetical protein